MITQEQVYAALAYYQQGSGRGWAETVRGMLEAAEKVAPLRASGFEVTDELVCIAGDAYCNKAGDGRWESGALRAALEAASAELAKHPPQPARFTVTLEQADAILDIYRSLGCERPRSPMGEDLRDAINEVMGGQSGEPEQPPSTRESGHVDVAELRMRSERNLSYGELCALHVCIVEAYRAGAQHSAGIARAAVDRLAPVAGEPEPARDVLTEEERKLIERVCDTTDRLEWPVGQLVNIVDRLAPKPAPVSPLEALLAEMKQDLTPGSVVGKINYYAHKLEAALARKEQGR